MTERDPANPDAEQQDPESAPAADAPDPNEAQRPGDDAGQEGGQTGPSSEPESS